MYFLCYKSCAFPDSEFNSKISFFRQIQEKFLDSAFGKTKLQRRSSLKVAFPLQVYIQEPCQPIRMVEVIAHE
jgi:hypothetical protein